MSLNYPISAIVIPVSLIKTNDSNNICCGFEHGHVFKKIYFTTTTYILYFGCVIATGFDKYLLFIGGSCNSTKHFHIHCLVNSVGRELVLL